MRTVLVSILILTLCLLTAPRILWAAPFTSERPNVLIIHVDQLRFDCLGTYGNPDIKTPNIDRLAADGVRYTNSFCAFPVCTPSRYSLLSGQYVHQHAGWDNRSTLSPAIATFPKIFRAAGYRTKAVGKMHFTPTYLDVGFDEMLLAEQDGPGRWDDDYHRYLMRLGLVDRNDLEDQRSEYRQHAPRRVLGQLGARVSNLPEAHHSTTWIAERAMETIRSWNAARKPPADGRVHQAASSVRSAGAVARDVRSRKAYDPARLDREEPSRIDLELQPRILPQRLV